MKSLRRRRAPRWLHTAASVVLAATFGFAPLTLLSPAQAAGLCATPGGSGAGGTLTGVVNTYYPGSGTAAAGATSITVGASSGAATPIAAGDLLLIIQMQDATFDFTNTNSYGHGGAAAVPASGYTALNSTGLYEYVRATSGVVAGSVGISGLGAGAGLLNTYRTAAATASAGQRTFQVVRVPQYTTATTSSTLTALAWNGSVGGVLALDTTGALTLSGTTSVDGLGFRGGVGIQRSGAAGFSTNDTVVSATANTHGNKAEGIGGTPLGTAAGNGYPGGDAARGAPGNAGGGGTDGDPPTNSENSGGGGGGNGGAGGQGGNTWSSNLALGGYGGVALTATSSRVFLGGGGGAGTTNNHTSPQADGADGGGIVLIRAGSVAGAGSITANGAAAYNDTLNDGGGAGGAGGTIVLTTPSGSLTGATLSATGGRGGDAWRTQSGAGNAHGPGGGGGGGWILTSNAPTSQTVTGGAHGITTTGNLTYGSANGADGQTGTVAPSAIPGVSGGAECADLSITKTGPATVVAGGSLSYTLSVANAGPSAASTLSVTDTLPAGVTFVSASGTGWSCSNSGNVSVTCTRAALASGATAPAITVVVTAPSQATTAVNTATVTAATPDPVTTNNTSTANTTVTASADLSIAKTGPATVTAAGSVSYSLTVANAGPSNAASLSVLDTLPAGVTFVSASGTGWSCTNSGNVSVTCTRAALATGATAPIITVVVTAPSQAASLTNSAAVSSATSDPNAANDNATFVTNVTASADLAMTKTGPATVTAAGSVSYSLTVRNNGPSDAATLSVLDTLPAGVTFVSASGTGWSCSNSGNVSVTCTRAALATATTAPIITVTVTAPNQATTLTNSASVGAATADPNPANNSSTANTTVTASADLALTKTGPASVTAAGSVSYGLTVRNNGPSDAASLSVLDTLPAGVTFVSASGTGWSCSNSGNVSVTCTRAALASGATAPAITVVVTAPNQAASLTNSASVSSATADPTMANNSSNVTTTVTASADLVMTKLGPPSVTAAGSVTYTLSVRNAGPSDAATLTVGDTLPAGVTFVSASGTGWSCSNSGNVSVTCTRAALVSGATAPDITLVVTAPNQAASLTNSAAVSSTTADPNMGNNSSSVSTSVTASADLSIDKSGPASVVAAGSVSYTLSVHNGGPSDAATLTVGDTLPAGVTFVSASGTGWSCSNSGNVSVTCTRAALVSGATAPDITVVVTAPNQATTLTNTASVSSTTADPSSANNTDATTTSVTASADLSIDKSGPASVTAAGSVSYTLSVRNGGPSDAASLTVGDTLPAGVTFVSASGTGWSCSNSGNVSVTCTRGALATGATAPDISVVVTAPNQAASLVNSASVSSATADPDPTDNADSVTTTVNASADLSIDKSGPASVVAAGSVSYTLSVHNGGPSDAANLTVGDTLPAGVTFVSASGTGWSCSNSGNVSVTCTRAALVSGATAPDITVVVTAPNQATTLTNTASVSSTTADPSSANNTDSVSTSVTASADLSIDKSGPASVTAAGSVSYTLSVHNGGPSDAATLTIGDTLPAGVTFVSASGTGWSCSNTGNVSVTCTRAALATGATAPDITVVVTAPNQATTLTNTASVSSTTADPSSANNTDSVSTSVTASADLSIDKSGPASVTAAGSVSYTLSVHNDGPSNAANLTVGDTLPAGVTFVSASGTGWSCSNTGNASVTCTRAALATGATAPDITVVVTAPAQAATLTNDASVTAATADPDLSNNDDSTTTSVTASADLSIDKSGPASVTAAGSVSYTLSVHNDGPSDAASVSVTDTLPAGVTFVSAAGTGWSCSNSGNVSVTCTRAALATGVTAPDITVVVTAPAQAATLTNDAAVTAATADPDLSNNDDSTTTSVTASADLSIDKSGPASVTASGTVTYTLSVHNAGPSDAANLTVGDTLPAGVTFVSATGTGWSCSNSGNVSVTCTRAALATGATAPDITVVVTAPSSSATLSNAAAVSSATPDPDPSDNTDTVTTIVGASADLALAKLGPPTVTAAGAVSYTLSVSNAGPSNAASLTVTDTLPAGVTFVSASGAGWSCSNSGNVSVTCTRATLVAGGSAPDITVVVTAPAQATTLTNSASVAATTPDPDLTNNADSVTTGVTAVADVSLTKSGPASVTAAGSVTYTLSVGNAGPSDAANVSVVDTLPAGVTFVSASGTGWSCSNSGNVSVTCTRAALATAATAPDITVVVTAPNQATTLTNTASVSTTTADPDSSDNTDSATTSVTASADLSIDKSGPASVVAAGSVSYTLSVHNDGPSDGASVSVTDTLPAGVTFVSASGTGWSCSNSGNVSVTCTRAALATGATAPDITVVVTAPNQAGMLSNAAAVSSATPDPDSSDNADSATTTVTASADLSIDKTGPATVTAAGSVTYTLSVHNAGPSDAATLSVTDTLPAGVTFVSAAGTGWSCTNSGNVSVTCTQAALATGATAPDITVVVTAPGQAGTLTNDAAVTAATADPNLSNNDDSTTTSVTASADLSIDKTGLASVTAAGPVTYTLSVGNVGPSDAANLSVVDTLPAGVTFVSASGTGWSCTHSGNVSVTCTRAALATGATAPDITVVVTAPNQAGTLTNDASVTAATADPDLSNNDDSVTTTVEALADLSIDKTGPATVAADGTVTYHLAVSNAGPSDAASVSVTDTLPAGVTFVSASGTGWSCTNSGSVSVTCTRAHVVTGATAPTLTVVVSAPPQAAMLTNDASVTAATADPDLTNNDDSVTTSVTSSADLSIDKTGPATVNPGGSVSYTLSVANAGPSDAAAVSVVDTLPAGVTFVSATGTGWSCSNSGSVSVTCTRATITAGSTAADITVVVTAPSSSVTLRNSASVSSSTADPDTSNDTDTADTVVGAAADLALVKRGPANADPGSRVRYHLSVSNRGPSAATGVEVIDDLPSGVRLVSASGSGWTCDHSSDTTVTCSRSSLAAGATAPVITVVVTAPGHAATLVNGAEVTGALPDLDPSNNADQVSTVVGPAADLSLVKTGPATVVAGESMTYHLVVTNHGPDDATDVRVVDTLPPGVRFVSASGAGWTCDHAGDVRVTCTRGLIADGTDAPPITVVVTAPSEATDLANRATVSSSVTDPVGGNNASTSPTVVSAGGGGSPTPHTGANGLGMVPVGLALLVLGGLLVQAGRREERD